MYSHHNYRSLTKHFATILRVSMETPLDLKIIHECNFIHFKTDLKNKSPIKGFFIIILYNKLISR
jgi:hypothetical protein